MGEPGFDEGQEASGESYVLRYSAKTNKRQRRLSNGSLRVARAKPLGLLSKGEALSKHIGFGFQKWQASTGRSEMANPLTNPVCFLSNKVKRMGSCPII